MFNFLKKRELEEIEWLKNHTDKQQNLLNQCYKDNEELKEYHRVCLENIDTHKIEINKLRFELESLILSYTGIFVFYGRVS